MKMRMQLSPNLAWQAFVGLVAFAGFALGVGPVEAAFLIDSFDSPTFSISTASTTSQGPQAYALTNYGGTRTDTITRTAGNGADTIFLTESTGTLAFAPTEISGPANVVGLGTLDYAGSNTTPPFASFANFVLSGVTTSANSFNFNIFVNRAATGLNDGDVSLLGVTSAGGNLIFPNFDFGSIASLSRIVLQITNATPGTGTVEMSAFSIDSPEPVSLLVWLGGFSVVGMATYRRRQRNQ